MRRAKLSIFLGVPGTGKTTIIKKILSKTNRRVLVVTADGVQWESLQVLNLKNLHDFSGQRKIYYHNDLFQLLNYTKFNNAILVLDDFRGLNVRSVKELEALETMVLRRRHRRLDIIIAAHGFTQIKPRFLFSYDPEFYLFETSDSILPVKIYLQKPAKIQEIQIRVNKKAEINPHYFEIIK